MPRPIHPFSLSLLLLTIALPTAAQDDRPTVTVGGEGTVATQPDQALVRFAIETRAQTAQEARTKNATTARQAMNAVRALDIPDEKMRMESLRIQPRYEYNDEKDTRELLGYEATRQVVVKVNRLDVLPQLVADVVQGGANRLDTIEYQLSDRKSYRNRALRKAARSAQEKATLLAETLGASLGAAHTINEQNFDIARPQPQAARMEMAKAAGDAGQAEPEAYAAGEIEVSAEVRVVFDLATSQE